MSGRLVVCLMSIATLGWGCSRGSLHGTFAPNQRPVVLLTHAPEHPQDRYSYAYEFKWSGYDPDGIVDYFVYAVDPTGGSSPETSWVATREFSQALEFSADEADSSGPRNQASRAHVFVIKAVDNKGLASAPEIRAFFASTIAPSVYITSPFPSALQIARVTSTVRISWTGNDADGIHTQKPVRYVWTLLSASSEFPLDAALADPDALRRFYAPDFAGWHPTSAETTSAQLFNLTPGANYVFAVVAFDEAGAYSPVFSFDTNMLRFRPDLASSLGPIITFSGPTFGFTYPSGGYSLDPNREVPVSLIPGQQMIISWSARPAQGSEVRGYRWRIDGDVGDETPRSDDTDSGHWSTLSALTTHVTVGPYAGGETHRLYLEVQDNNGNRSLGIARLEVASFDTPFNRELLIVDDTRLWPDQAAPGGCMRPPVGSWPTAAELDTFLYAKGGTTWRCYPPGTVTPPGLFAAYAFDTIGTKPETTPFSLLGRYRHVIWVLDGQTALSGESALRYMTQNGQLNTLAIYVQKGGQLWLVGGGAATAARATFMSEQVGWQSTYKAQTLGAYIQPSERIPMNDPNAPSYARLPPRLDPKFTTTDPFPPGREGQPLSVFYKSIKNFEYLTAANHVTEPDPRDPNTEVAVLDTLYKVFGPGLPTSENPIMTYYRPSGPGHVLFTGFDIWNYQRGQLGSLVDFVLQDLWGIAPQMRVAP